MMRLGVIGAGNISGAHIKVAPLIADQVKIVALADPAPAPLARQSAGNQGHIATNNIWPLPHPRGRLRFKLFLNLWWHPTEVIQAGLLSDFVNTGQQLTRRLGFS